MSEAERTATTADGDWLTLQEAAHFLGIRSQFAVVRWLQDRLLVGGEQRGQVFVSRCSLESMATNPAVAAERAYERSLYAVLEECPDAEPAELADLTGMTRRHMLLQAPPVQGHATEAGVPPLPDDIEAFLQDVQAR